MSRTTIDFGIDLGTTNSTVAVLQGTSPEIVTAEDESSVVPSAVWIDKRGKLVVGREARARHVDDSDNAAIEFKLQMGQDSPKLFRRSGRTMLPEELSAAVLKELRQNVRTKTREELSAAVVTVPAAFEQPQCQATDRAAKLAGIESSPLLQEPVAAALAYGFQAATNKVFWMVYDFGGGTFDAAVIQVRDGVIQVVNHAGDNFLGGKNIDWDIVEKTLIPELTGQRSLTDFSRKNPKWRSAFAKLKYYAEEAKVRVSRTREPAEVWIEDLCNDDRGDTIDFQYELTPSTLESIINPYLEQSVTLCRRALQEKRLAEDDIEKFILVGGTSLLPWLQERVSAELGDRLAVTIDPISVVARGAAVFAGTQARVASTRAVQSGEFGIQLEYEPVGTETDPVVGGRVTGPDGVALEGLEVEICETKSQWRSGRIALGKDGTFMTEILAERGRKNEFEILLFDRSGEQLKCSPSRFPYTIGMVITSPPLTHSIGVAMANNQPNWFFKKGDPLPARTTQIMQNVCALRRNETYGEHNTIKVPVIEGENGAKADRNRLIGAIEIRPDDPRVRRDVPIGSDIEVTMELDASRTAVARAYVPILDEEFEGVFDSKSTPKTPEELNTELQTELRRLAELRRRAEEAADQKASSALGKLESMQIVQNTERQVAAAQGDPDARGEGDKKLLDLKAQVDVVENALEWPTLVDEAHSQRASTKEVVDEHGTAEEKQWLENLDRDIEEAIAAERVAILRAKIEEVRGLGSRVVLRQPSFWVGYLEYLRERRDHMTDPPAASALFSQASRAINGNDIEGLRAAVRQLIGLLPPEEQEDARARGQFGGTIVTF